MFAATPSYVPSPVFVPVREANYGGPMSRTRSERLRVTVLGLETGDIHCPRRLRLALDFGRRNPCRTMRKLLEERGLRDPEELRGTAVLPGPMLCRPNWDGAALKVGEAEPDEVLRQAFLLGLCTAVYFDPRRPVLWTEASLSRRVELFETLGFYA